MKKPFVLPLIILCCISSSLKAQQHKAILPNPFYSVAVTNIDKKGGVALQSFINGRKGDTILLIGGRIKGLHNFNGTAFPFSTSNNRLMVYVPGNGSTVQSKVFSSAIPASLPVQGQLQLASTNMQFCQHADTLYSFGGFGFNGIVQGDSCYGTFNSLFAVQVSGLINAIVTGDTLNNKLGNYFTFSQQPNPSDSTMAVTGGELVKMGSDYYLVMGQDFQGHYGTGQVHYQRYTNTVTQLRFSYTPNRNLSYTVVQNMEGPSLSFHRRDLNVVPVIGTNGKEGIDVYGGVFTPTVNGGPYLNPVKFRMNHLEEPFFTIDSSLTQYFNQYASAHVLLYDAKGRTMFSTILGGISLYDKVREVNNHRPIAPSDTTMPWSRVISTIIRDSIGSLTEFASDNDPLPAYIGAEARFVPYKKFLKDGSEEIIDYNKVVLYANRNKTNAVQIGFLFGGILSVDSAGTLTNSDPSLYKVELKITTAKNSSPSFIK